MLFLRHVRYPLSLLRYVLRMQSALGTDSARVLSLVVPSLAGLVVRRSRQGVS